MSHSLGFALSSTFVGLALLGCSAGTTSGGGGSTSTTSATNGSGGQTGATTGAATTGTGKTTSTAGPGSTTGTGMVGAVHCSTPSTAYQMNGGTCGSWRWAPKTGTDNQVNQINLVPELTTLAQLTALPTVTGTTCGRTPNELKTYELKNVNIKFEALEADSDYHLIVWDQTSANTMVVEVPYPGCVGHYSCQSSQPLLCDITHARAAVDAKNPTGAKGTLGVGTIIGVGFFDTDELMMTPGPAGEAPNGIELHPVLAICFGQNCDPLAGY